METDNSVRYDNNVDHDISNGFKKDEPIQKFNKTKTAKTSKKSYC